MHPDFDLVVSADDATTATLRLLDEGGRQIGYREIDFNKLELSTV